MPRVVGLDPIIDDNARVLILGSMPGNESLRKGEYYAHPKNQFWKILFSIFDMEQKALYSAKVSFLKEKRIALWDVIKQCDREGSADSKITNVCINELPSLLATYPQIKHLFFNGQKAFDIFNKEVKPGISSEITLKRLPSTSPANATISVEAKIKEWGIIKTLLLY